MKQGLATLAKQCPFLWETCFGIWDSATRAAEHPCLLGPTPGGSAGATHETGPGTGALADGGHLVREGSRGRFGHRALGRGGVGHMD